MARYIDTNEACGCCGQEYKGAAGREAQARYLRHVEEQEKAAKAREKEQKRELDRDWDQRVAAIRREERAEAQASADVRIRAERAEKSQWKDKFEALQEKRWKRDEESEAEAVEKATAPLHAQIARQERALKAVEQKLLEAERRKATPDELGATGQRLLCERVQAACPKDDCTETVRGRKGTDVFQTVRAADRRDCGLVVWENKNDPGTSFDSKWIDTARADLHRHRAAYIVIVAHAVPKRKAAVKADGGGILVTTPDGVEALASVLHALLVAQATRGVTQTAAMALLSSGRFQRDLNAVVKDVEEDRAALDKEMREHEKAWDVRKQRSGRMRERMVALVDDMLRALESDAQPSKQAS
jgi:hypothetical protein